MGTIDTMKFEILNFSMFGLVLAWFGWNWSQNVRFIQKNAMVLKGIYMVLKEPYMSLF